MSSTRTDRNNRTLVIILSALALIIALLWFFREEHYNWMLHSYSEEDEEPYGADLTFKYLRSLREKGDFAALDSTVASNLRPYLTEEESDFNYVILGYSPYLDSLDKEHLFQFVEKGNSAFLLTGSVSAELLSDWHGGECLLYDQDEEYEYYDYGYEEEYDYTPDLAYVDSTVSVNFLHPDLKLSEDLVFSHQVKDEIRKYTWPYVDGEYFCEENVSLTPLGTINDQVNFFRVPYGEGFFYVHTNPKLLTNFYLAKDEGRVYADRVFAHLEAGPIIWDKKLWQSEFAYKDRYAQHEGPLTYLLSQESLRWMLYLLFAMVILLFVFGTRRRQRPIPVVRPKENSSMEYVDTISELYFSQSGDGQIFRYLSEQFQFYIRKKYRINFKWKEEETWAMLAKAAGIPLDHIKQIGALHARGSYAPNVNQTMLADYYRLMDHFYTHCK